ncbi:ABC transporter permease [Mesorhizobium sp. M0622]|uniref:ABC transporter permease n=1 Tax=unclassified Mesorhizobium TaxID=325217 RepID=UPI003338A4D1
MNTAPGVPGRRKDAGGQAASILHASQLSSGLKPTSRKSLWSKAISKPEFSAFLMLVAVFAAFQLYTGFFLSYANTRLLLTILPELGIVVLGVTILMIAGEFDLSVGSVFALVPMTLHALTARYGVDPYLALVLVLGLALLVGYINGAVTLSLGIPSFITTLGMLFVARSMSIVAVGGNPLALADYPFGDVLVVNFGYIRASLIWYVGLAVVLGVWLHASDFGNWIFATGGQAQAAKDLGINTRRVKITAFMLCSLLAGLAGIIQMLRTKAPLPSMGTGLELEVIAGAVIGGTALTGGVGSIIGAIIGAILIRSIDNGLVMSRVNAEWFRTALGVLIVVSVVLNVKAGQFFSRRR